MNNSDYLRALYAAMDGLLTDLDANGSPETAAALLKYRLKQHGLAIRAAAPAEPRIDVERLAEALFERVTTAVAAYSSRGAAAAPPAAGLDRPEIVCLCGSTRFYDEFQQANYDLTMAGKIVLSVGFYPHAKAKHGHGEGVGHDSSEKVALDELHKRKIDLADWVLVLNKDGYVGESTRSEIEYAEAHGKPVDYLVDMTFPPPEPPTGAGGEG